MAVKRKPKWNPDYKKVWVRIALQNALSKDEYDGITPHGKKLIKEILLELDDRAREQEEDVNEG